MQAWQMLLIAFLAGITFVVGLIALAAWIAIRLIPG